MSETSEQRPIQLRIVDDIRADIDSGALRPGAPLPSYRQLMATYDVSTQTAQRAIGILKAEGIVESRAGKGVFVRPRPNLLSRMISPTVVESLNGDPVDMTARRSSPPKDVAEALGVGEDEKLVAAQALLVADGQFVEILTSYFPPQVTVLEPALAAPEGGLLAELRRQGSVPRRITEDVQTRMPTPEEARILRLSVGVAVFRVLRSVLADDGSVLGIQTSVLAGDRYQLRYELPIHD